MQIIYKVQHGVTSYDFTAVIPASLSFAMSSSTLATYRRLLLSST